MDRIRALIVDDEPLARDKIKKHLETHPEVVVVGECGDGRSAVSAVRKLSPHLLFLDVQMPGIDGFGVLEALDGDRVPTVVFVTAYDKYALRAFDVHALDYLLKPFDRERFDKALGRAMRQVRSDRTAAVEQRLMALLQDLKAGEPGAGNERYVDRLVVKTGGRVIFLGAVEIDWIEAQGNYVRLHVGKDSYLMRETMTGIEARLRPREFVRIHRSYIVRIDRIREMQPWSHGEYVLVLKDGSQLTSSRGYRGQVGRLLGVGGGEDNTSA